MGYPSYFENIVERAAWREPAIASGSHENRGVTIKDIARKVLEEHTDILTSPHVDLLEKCQKLENLLEHQKAVGVSHEQRYDRLNGEYTALKRELSAVKEQLQKATRDLSIASVTIAQQEDDLLFYRSNRPR